MTREIQPGQPGRLLAAAALVAVPLSGALLGWAATGPMTVVGAPGPAPVDALVALIAAGAALLVLGVLTAAITVDVLAALTRRGETLWARTAAGLTPALVRRLLELALGVALLNAPATAALAAGSPPTGPVGSTAALSTSDATGLPSLPSVDRPAGSTAPPDAPPNDGWRPDRPASVRRTPPAPVRLVTATPRFERARRDTVVVRRGDSLWRIVARYLGPTASAADVATEWPRWYAANRSVIGADPDLLRPGQQLIPPTGAG